MAELNLHNPDGLPVADPLEKGWDILFRAGIPREQAAGRLFIWLFGRSSEGEVVTSNGELHEEALQPFGFRESSVRTGLAKLRESHLIVSRHAGGRKSPLHVRVLGTMPDNPQQYLPGLDEPRTPAAGIRLLPGETALRNAVAQSPSPLRKVVAQPRGEETLATVNPELRRLQDAIESKRAAEAGELARGSRSVPSSYVPFSHTSNDVPAQGNKGNVCLDQVEREQPSDAALRIKTTAEQLLRTIRDPSWSPESYDGQYPWSVAWALENGLLFENEVANARESARKHPPGHLRGKVFTKAITVALKSRKSMLPRRIDLRRAFYSLGLPYQWEPRARAPP